MTEGEVPGRTPPPPSGWGWEGVSWLSSTQRHGFYLKEDPGEQRYP